MVPDSSNSSFFKFFLWQCMFEKWVTFISISFFLSAQKITWQRHEIFCFSELLLLDRCVTV
jgi:hypothetical protein